VTLISSSIFVFGSSWNHFAGVGKLMESFCVEIYASSPLEEKHPQDARAYLCGKHNLDGILPNSFLPFHLWDYYFGNQITKV